MRKLLGLIAIIAVLFGCERVEEAIKETTVSGTVRNGGEPVSGAIVLLLESETLAEGLSLGGGWITGSDGKYEIIRVESGNYFVPAIKSEDLVYNEGDLVGWFGEKDTLTGLTIPEQITVEETDLTGIDIDTLYIAP